MYDADAERYKAFPMPYARCGASGLKLPRVSTTTPATSISGRLLLRSAGLTGSGPDIESTIARVRVNPVEL